MLYLSSYKNYKYELIQIVKSINKNNKLNSSTKTITDKNTPDKSFAEISEKLPSYAQPTVAFQLRISLQHNGARLSDEKLPVCQRYSMHLQIFKCSNYIFWQFSK